MSTISQNSNNDTVRTISEGRYRLPTVLIQYADGTSQDLLIEVGPPIDSLSVPSIFPTPNPNSNSNSNLSNDTNTTSTPNTETTTANTTSTANSESVDNNNNNNNNTTNSNDSTINQQQTEIPGVAIPATAAPSSSTPYRRRVLSESAVSPSATNPERRGIRGLDYPAFDVTPEGVYGQNSTTSEFLNRLISPINRSIQQQQQLQQLHTHSNREAQGQENPFPNLIGNNRRPTTSSRPSEPSRNIILTVNYIYGRPETPNNTNTFGTTTDPVVPVTSTADQTTPNPTSNPISNPPNQSTETPTFDGIGSNTTDISNQINNISNLSGSLILHVPNIDDSDDDSLQVLVRLATTIALRTIATSVKKISGVNDDHFARLKTKNANDLNESDRYCPICYDPYQEIDRSEVKQDDEDEEVEDENDESNKRKKSSTNDGQISDNSDSNETSPRKRRKINSDSRYSTSEHGSTTDTDKDTTTNNLNDKKDKSEYTHVPVLMPCEHVFGRSCLREWLKTNNSCPLCRLSIPIPRSESNDTNSETTIILPNLARVISESRRVITSFNSRHLTFIIPDQMDGINRNDSELEESNNSNDNNNDNNRNDANITDGVDSITNPSTSSTSSSISFHQFPHPAQNNNVLPSITGSPLTNRQNLSSPAAILANLIRESATRQQANQNRANPLAAAAATTTSVGSTVLPVQESNAENRSGNVFSNGLGLFGQLLQNLSNGRLRNSLRNRNDALSRFFRPNFFGSDSNNADEQQQHQQERQGQGQGQRQRQRQTGASRFVNNDNSGRRIPPNSRPIPPRRNEFVNRDPLFPVGMESFRTASGVVTRPIHSTHYNNNNNRRFRNYNRSRSSASRNTAGSISNSATPATSNNNHPDSDARQNQNVIPPEPSSSTTQTRSAIDNDEEEEIINSQNVYNWLNSDSERNN